ncbi:MAG TPA: tetratricopeptide repeat protein [Verrucomicrobiae bacterium]|nr:tetratricopeptide repeat protein [Verrucomicrobiae bacterium]
MKRLWLILVVLLIAATPADETRLFRVAQATFDDKLYDVAERQFAEFLAKFPQSERADNVQFLLAQAQLNQGKWQEAVKSLEDALVRWPDKRPDAIHFWLAEALARGDKYAEAQAHYTEVLDKFSHSLYRAQALYGLAFVQIKLNQFDAAGDTLDQLAKLPPKGDLALEAELLRGQLYLGEENFAKADAAFDGVSQKAPGTRAFYRAQLWLGRSLTRRKQFDEALQHFATVIDAFKTKPNKPVDGQLAAEAWYAKGWTEWLTEKFDAAADSFTSALANAQTPQLKRDALLKLGEAYVRSGKLADGVAKLKEFLQAHPADPLADEVQMAIADWLFAGNDFAAALPEYGQLITKYPQSALLVKANLNAGWCAWKLKQPADALKFFQQAFTLTKDSALAAEALFKVADAQFALGQYADAIASYQRLIGSYTDAKSLDRAMFQLGEAYRQIRNAEAAMATFESLVSQYPTSPLAPEAQFNVGLVDVGLGREKDARTAFGVVMEKFADSEWANRAALAIGESFYRDRQYSEALASFQKLMANGLDTELAQQAFYSYGWCRAMMGEADKTLTDFTDFLKKYPQAPLAPDIEFWIGDYYAKKKDYLGAQEQFQLLVKNYPTSKQADTAQYMAARAAYSRQDYDSAIKLYEALVKTFPESAWRCDARFGQADALTELGQFDNALLVFDNLAKEFPDCYLACEAYGRIGDCQYTLTHYDDAIASYRKALDCAKDASMRAQVQFKIGQSYEKLGKLDDALQFYIKPVYEKDVAPDPNEPQEKFWSCKAGRAAAGIKEQQQQWREAITLYEKLAKTCSELQPLADDRIRRIRVEHGILF